MRKLATILALGVAFACAPAVADAATTAGTFYGDGGDFVSFGMTGSDDRDVVAILFESIAEHPGTARVVVADAGGVTPYGKCESLATTAAVCHRYQGTGVGSLRGGDDILSISGDVDGTFSGDAGADRISDGWGAGTLEGNADADRLSGNVGDDVLGGGSGDDVLEGGPGADVLRGGPGRDKLRGGPGDDRIDASGGRRDREIECGPGDDTAIIDFSIDPPTSHCEHVVPS